MAHAAGGAGFAFELARPPRMPLPPSRPPSPPDVMPPSRVVLMTSATRASALPSCGVGGDHAGDDHAACERARVQYVQYMDTRAWCGASAWQSLCRASRGRAAWPASVVWQGGLGLVQVQCRSDWTHGGWSVRPRSLRSRLPDTRRDGGRGQWARWTHATQHTAPFQTPRWRCRQDRAAHRTPSSRRQQRPPRQRRCSSRRRRWRWPLSWRGAQLTLPRRLGGRRRGGAATGQQQCRLRGLAASSQRGCLRVCVCHAVRMMGSL